MIRRFLKIRFVDETDEDNPVVVFEKKFVTVDRWNKDVQDTVYNKVLELNALYNFCDYENCSLIIIYYIEVTEKDGVAVKEDVMHRDDCVDYFYNL